MAKVICGIQQIGVGVTNVYEAWKWYREFFGMDIRIFDEEAVAELMLPHTDGAPRKRHAVLAINLQSGGGFEIWQHTGRTPLKPEFEVQLGDLGIFITKIKCKDINKAYAFFKEKGANVLSAPAKNPAGKEHFFLKDPYGNIFQLETNDYWLREENKQTGAVLGAVIGVSDIEKSMEVYGGILGYTKVIYDQEGTFEDLSPVSGGNGTFRRVLLTHPNPNVGGFSKLFGPSYIELVQAKDRTPRRIYENRMWGDPGFIHLCFDIRGMNDLREECSSKGYNFTVDSANSFDMGEAAGHFSYIEDPDGTLIEFVETHKVPVMKKLGIYINLKKRPAEKSIPLWMIKSLRFNRYKGD